MIIFFSVNLKDIKTWLPRINCKLSNSRLREKYSEVDPEMKDLNYEGFAMLYHKLINQHVVSIQTDQISLLMYIHSSINHLQLHRLASCYCINMSTGQLLL